MQLIIKLNGLRAFVPKVFFVIPGENMEAGVVATAAEVQVICAFWECHRS